MGQWNPMCTTAQVNPVCPSYPTVLCGTDGTVLWNLCTTARPILCVRPTCPMWDRQWNPMCTTAGILWNCPMWDRWDSPMYHCTGVSVLSHWWDTWDSPMESHVYHCPYPSYPTVLCGTDGTVLWNPMCTTAQANPMCPSYPTVLCGTHRMGQSYGIPCVPLHRPILCVRPIPLSYVGQWDSPMESHVYHCTGQSYVSVLSHCPM